jgi:hypothetical protein
MAKRRAFDAGGDNNNCMILSVLACAPKELGGCTPARAREVRNELAFMISVSAGTELGKQAHDAMRVLHAWKTANPAEFTADVSCPCADACMHIEDEAECLEAAAKFVRGHYMLGAIELPFLKAWAAQKGVHVVEVTSESGGLDTETSAWVDAQVAQAPEDMKVAVIVSDSVHYQALLDGEPPVPAQIAAVPEIPSVTKRIRRIMAAPIASVVQAPVAAKAKARSGWPGLTVGEVVMAIIVGSVIWVTFVRPALSAA